MYAVPPTAALRRAAHAAAAEARRTDLRQDEASARRAQFANDLRRQRQQAAVAARQHEARVAFQPRTPVGDAAAVRYALSSASSLRVADRVFPQSALPEAVARRVDSYLDGGCGSVDGWRLCASPGCRRECIVNFVNTVTRVATELFERDLRVLSLTFEIGVGRCRLEISRRQSGGYVVKFSTAPGTRASITAIRESIPATWEVLQQRARSLSLSVPALSTAVIGTFARFLFDKPDWYPSSTVPDEVAICTVEQMDDQMGFTTGCDSLNVRTGEIRAFPDSDDENEEPAAAGAAGAAGGGARSKRSRRHRTPRQAPARKQARSRRRHSGSRTPAFRRTRGN
jgi:hypothetical protein